MPRNCVLCSEEIEDGDYCSLCLANIEKNKLREGEFCEDNGF